MTKLSPWKIAGAVFLISAVTAIAAQAPRFTTLVKFKKDNGAYPHDTFIQGIDGNLYATTAGGGSSGRVIQMDTLGDVPHTVQFDGSDGAMPYGGLVQTAARQRRRHMDG